MSRVASKLEQQQIVTAPARMNSRVLGPSSGSEQQHSISTLGRVTCRSHSVKPVQHETSFHVVLLSSTMPSDLLVVGFQLFDSHLHVKGSSTQMPG